MKLEDLKSRQFWLLVALLVLLPSQLGRHFWPASSLVNGIRVDYLSPALYLTDLLIVGLLLIALLINLPSLINFPSILKKQRKMNWQLKGLVLLAGLLIAVGIKNSGVHWYGWLRILELAGLFLVVKQIKLPSGWKYWGIAAMLIWPAAIGLGQFLVQHSLGGGVFWLGERTFSLATPGIAKAVIFGELKLRSYSTFSHPNSLAGFFLVGWLLFWNSYQQIKKKDFWHQGAFLTTSLLVITVLGLSWSRTVWITALFLFLLGKSKLIFKKEVFIILLISGFIFPLFLIRSTSWLLPVGGLEEVNLRNQLFIAGWQLFKENPIFGVGLNNFIPSLADYQLALGRSWLQPIHNCYWLILVELGLSGAIIVLWGLWQTLCRIDFTGQKSLLLALLAVLLTGANDHYWLTLPQNQLLLTILIAWIWQKKRQGPKLKQAA